MTSARRLWRLQIAFGLTGTAGASAALVVALTRVDFSVPSAAELAQACQRWALPHTGSMSLLVLGLGSLGLAALALTARAALRHVRASRRFEQRLRVVGAGPNLPHIYVLADERPHAFCVGWLRPRIYVSRGALAALDREERAAVIAHEAHHARRRDPLRLAIARSLGEGLFFLPVVARLADRYGDLAEVAADEAAVRAGHGPRALAGALLALDAHPSPAAVGIAPERVDHLLGHRARWELPLIVVLGGLVTIGVLGALTVRVVEAADHASIGLPALIAQTCMLLMAAVPIMLGASALLGGRRLLRRR